MLRTRAAVLILLALVPSTAFEFWRRQPSESGAEAAAAVAPVTNSTVADELSGQATEEQALGWRGILALHALVVDWWLLAGAVISYVPYSVRVHWAAEPLWIAASFLALSNGIDELVAVAEPWLGPRFEPALAEPFGTISPERLETSAMAAFAALSFVHLAAMLFAPNNQRKRLCCLGLMISGLTLVAHGSLNASPTVTSTYGRPFQPLRHFLWAHTSPALALIVAGPSDLPACQTHLRLTRMVVVIMATGTLATLRVPPLPPSAHPLAAEAFTYLWRGGWLAASSAAFVIALRRILRLVQQQMMPPLRRGAVCVLVVTAWSLFPLVWLLAQLELVSVPQEHQLLALGDFAAKMLASVILMQGTAAGADSYFRRELRQLLDKETTRAGVLHTFARSMGHDLRTPLQALVFSLHISQKSLAELIASHETVLGPKADLSRAEAQECLRGHLASLEKLMEQVLQEQACSHMLSLIVSNLWELDPEPGQPGSTETDVLLPTAIEDFDLHKRMADIVQLLKVSPSAKPHVRIETALDPQIPTLRGDLSKLMRAVLNLLTNALKFTDQGIVMLSAYLVRRQDGIATIRFEVSDTGMGMTESQIDSATMPYVHAPVEEHGGMGLGLSIVSKGVAALGGKLVITSPGIGLGTRCTFNIDLEEVELSSPATADRADKKVMRVMLVDDVEVVLSGAKHIVSSLGHTVVCTATEGEQALRLLTTRADEIDVVFMDIRLPKIFGDAVVAQYRAWERQHRGDKTPLRIYATSGDASQSMLHALEASGFDGTLAKPVYPASYQQALETSAPSGKAASSSVQLNAGGGELDEAQLARQMTSRLPKTVINCHDMITELGFTTDLAVQLLETAKKYLIDQRASLHAAAQKKDWTSTTGNTKTVHGTAHSVKGAVEQIFAVRLSIATRSLMDLAKAGESIEARAALLVWDQEMEKLLTGLATQSYEVLFEGPIHDHGKAEFWTTTTSRPAAASPSSARGSAAGPAITTSSSFGSRDASFRQLPSLAPDADAVATLGWIKQVIARHKGEQQEMMEKIEAALDGGKTVAPLLGI